MNCGWCLSYQNDSFRLKQDQALDFLDPDQNPDTNNQLSSIGENQRDVEAIHHFFNQLHAMLGFLHHVHVGPSGLNNLRRGELIYTNKLLTPF